VEKNTNEIYDRVGFGRPRLFGHDLVPDESPLNIARITKADSVLAPQGQHLTTLPVLRNFGPNAAGGLAAPHYPP
jgi:hypothetical protein